MNTISVTFLLFYAFFSVTGIASGQVCEKLTELSGEIYDSHTTYSSYTKCWILEVPQNSYIRLNFTQLSLGYPSCSLVYVKVFVHGANETYMFCSPDTNPNPINAFNDVTVTFHHNANGYSSTLRLKFTTENMICAQRSSFRCTQSSCIHDYQVCNGIKDCTNGADEVECVREFKTVTGMNESRINAINWLKNQRSKSFGWGKDTHRAITALFLSHAMTFQGNNLEEELIAKQLELQTSVTLLRNASDPISISELSMFVNALTVTCHNPRHFYGYDLLQILHDRVTTAKSPVPSAYLTLCNLNWTISHSEMKKLTNLLHKDSEYPFNLDVRALTVMALTCIRGKTNNFTNIEYDESLYNSTIQNFARQLPDGSFGNVYTTALVTQALISSGQVQSKQWNATAAVRYLKKQLNSSSVDFLSVYLTLPIFSGTSLVNINTVDCSNKTREKGKDREISELTEKLGGRMQIQYSLYIGDQKNVIHTIYLRMPENSTAYDVMRVAQFADSKYKFLQRDVSGHMYVYEIAGIINDPEAGKFWLLYTGEQNVDDSVEHYTDSPDKFTLKEGDHLIMWYRTVHI